MNNSIYNKKQTWKLLIFLFAVMIGVSSLWYTNKLVDKLSYEERKKIELWAEATQQLATLTDYNTDINFLVKIIQNNETVPVILTNAEEEIISYRNLDTLKVKNPSYLRKVLREMKEQHEPIEIDLGENNKNYIFYKDSTILTQLYYYPFIQLSVIILFILISYYAFSISRKAEQNQVWLGLTKETAHQLGTPTSSLLAWVELLRLKNVDKSLVAHFEKDINRLEKITERFSKIGSRPSLDYQDVYAVVKNVKEYLEHRFSSNVTFHFNAVSDKFIAPINTELFEWVIENVCKNAYDALVGEKGEITLHLKKSRSNIYLDISDTGKGIPKRKQKTIFKPGFTTKKRGWGLGLSLSKRIIENYHDGRIFVAESELGKGTTIRIILHAK